MLKLVIFLKLLLILPLCLGQSSENHIRNLVFEGGGIRGVAYAGALMELQSRSMLDSIERVAGTSAGAIAATLFAVGYTPEEIAKLTSELKIKSLADGKWIFIGGTRRLIRNFGWYKGEKFNRWISKLIKEKTGKENLSFIELFHLAEKNTRYKNLYLTGTNLSKQTTSIFCYETFPDMEIRTAVHISMCIPFYFQAVVIDQQGKLIAKKKNQTDGNVMVDGGILANYPIHVFDFTKYLLDSNDSTSVINPETLGLRLDSDEQIAYDRKSQGLAPCEIKKFTHFTNAFYNIILENLNRNNLCAEDWQRTISISTAGVGAKIKKLSMDDKNMLIEKGKNGVRYYFEGKH